MPSVTIGRFEVIRELGRSELGIVYKAHDPKRKRTVALRVLRCETPEAAERARQYLVEAKAASVLDSPNIVTIYAGAEEQGLAYVAMEYIEGVPLDTALASEQGFSTGELVDISRQVCRGLDHAHSKGIFHRSLQPSNITTEWDGTIKIMNFGLHTATQVSPGHILNYTSPEQLQGREPDARSNLFSWGAILYEMVTGKQAFSGQDAESVRRAIIEVMPPVPSDINPKAHPGIARVIMKALAKNPEYRFQHGSDLVGELETEYRSGQRTTVAVPPINSPELSKEPAPPVIPGLSPNTTAAQFGMRALDPGMAAPAVGMAAPPPLAATPIRPLTLEPVIAVPPSSKNWQPNGNGKPAQASRVPTSVPGTVVPVPRRAPAPASSLVALTPKQLKIVLGVIAGAVFCMLLFMVVDHFRARQAEKEMPPAVPIEMATPEPVPAAIPLPPPEPEPVVEDVTPTRRAVPRAARHKSVSAPTPMTGALMISSVPQGAQVVVDNSGSFVTPVSLASLSPGQHLVVISKPGYTTESHTVTIYPSTKGTLAVSLAQLGAVASVGSEPAGASIFVDGRDTGKVTPARLTLEKGSHSLALRKAGYLETSTNVNLGAGETLQLMPSLKPLGNADDIHPAGGKFKKLLGHGGAPENACRVLVRTFPKNAQIMFNQRMMDQDSPAEFLLPPGTYQVTLTLTGYKPIHKTITVEPGGRFEVNATFEQ